MSDELQETTRINVITTPYDLEAQSIVCYPNLVVEFKANIFRLFMTPRTVYSTITVDLVRGQAARSNMFPHSEEMEIHQTAVIPSLISVDDGIEQAKRLLLKWLRHKFHIYKVPDIEVLRRQEVFKAFFQITDHDGETMLVDSVRGVEV